MGLYVSCCVLLKSAHSLCIKFIMRLKSTVLRKKELRMCCKSPLSHHINVDTLLSQNLAEAGAKIYIGLILSGFVNKCIQTPKEMKGT